MVYNIYYNSHMVETTQKSLQSLSKSEIETKDGQYDSDGFFILKDKSFYDPLGYFFDAEGKDALGGKYNEEGYYEGTDEAK